MPEEKRPEWIMIGGFRVTTEMKKKFEAALIDAGYKNMSDCFRDFMRNLIDGVRVNKKEIEAMIDARINKAGEMKNE